MQTITKDYNNALLETIEKIKELQKELIDTKIQISNNIDNAKKIRVVAELNNILSSMLVNNIAYIKNNVNLTDYQILTQQLDNANNLARQYENTNDSLRYISTNELENDTKDKVKELQDFITDKVNKIKNNNTNNNGGEE